MHLRRLIPEIPVADVQRSVAFYEQHLGFEVLHADGDFAMLELDEQRLDVARREGFGTRLWLVVSDIKELHERLDASDGVEVSDIVPRRYWVWEFELTDPDGTQLMIVQPPPAPGLDIPEIFEAIVESDEDAVAEFLATDPQEALSARGPYWGWTRRSDWSTIQVAAGAGTPYILQMLLEAGADATGGARVDADWWSPIHCAALRNRALVEPLLAAGAELDACTAAAMGWLDRLKQLPLELGSGAASPLHFAAAAGQLEVVEWLVAQPETDTSNRDRHFERTPRQWAEWAEEGRAEIEALLPAVV